MRTPPSSCVSLVRIAIQGQVRKHGVDAGHSHRLAAAAYLPYHTRIATRYHLWRSLTDLGVTYNKDDHDSHRERPGRG